MAPLEPFPLRPGLADPDDWPDDVPDEVRRAATQHFLAAGRLDAEGRYDEAFAQLEAGNALMRPALKAESWVAARARAVKALKAVFTRGFFAEHATRNPVTAPIFIVGLPRSGSTLVEQILASHPKVQGMGESPAMLKTLRDAYPINPLGRFDPPSLAKDYLGHIRAEGWRGKPSFTDKMLASFAAIGHIHLMFPRAVILHTVREPADTCFSCYGHIFGDNSLTRFSYDLTDLGRFYVGYREMMDHWRTTLVGRVIDVKNEDLVADPEGQIRRLLEVCRLPWDERCLRFHENPREVRTTSAEQVRRPIFTSSIGRWRRYRKHLGPLFEALGPYAPADAD